MAEDDDDPHAACDICGEEHPEGVLDDGLCPSCLGEADEPVTCTECDGTGKGDYVEADDLDPDDDDGVRHDCPVYCGFGRLDW